MTIGRPLVLAILVYVTLDLSVAWMPGAFVFEAADTVESVRTNGATIATPAPALRCDWLLPEGSVPRMIVTAVAPRLVFWPRGSGLRDASVEAVPSPTDDPH